MTEDMPRPRLPYLRREKSRHGSWCWYFRKDDGPRIRIKADYGTAEFKAAYNAALLGQPIEAPAEPGKGTVAWAVERYKASGRFQEGAESTRYFRANFLKQMVAAVGQKPLTSITKRDIQKSMEKRASTPHHANNMLTAISLMYDWAKDNLENVEANPCDGVKRFRTKIVGHHTWTVDEVEQYRDHHRLGTMARLALDLLLFTGLRRSDIINVGRQHVKDGLISMQTQKTGAWVHLPIFDQLRESINATPSRGRLTFIAGERGMKFSSGVVFGAAFRAWCKEAGLPAGCTPHGLRKAGATIAADDGSTPHELMAMFGWTKVAMAEVYTKDADKKRLARAAAERIANAFPPHREKGAAAKVE